MTMITANKQDSFYQEKMKALQALVDDIPAVIIVHELKNLTVEYMSPRGLNVLGIPVEKLKSLSAQEYHNRFFNAQDAEDYLPKILKFIERGNDHEIITYFQQVRATEQDDWKWYLSTSKIFIKDEDGNPTHLITTACPIDPEHNLNSKVNRLLEENNFLRNNHALFSTLTKREKEMLKFMALGKNSADIAELFHISEKTAITHRRNIRSKLNAQSNYDLICFAQAFDLI